MIKEYRIKIILGVEYPDFEYVACSHTFQHNGGNTDTYV